MSALDTVLTVGVILAVGVANAIVIVIMVAVFAKLIDR